MLAASTAASAGITIPAGDWTIDIGGNVNAFYTNFDSQTKTNGVKTANGSDANTIGTGLLPAALGVGGKTRQNDLDVAFQFTFFTGTSSGGSSELLGANTTASGQGGALRGNTMNVRQAYLTFGDASWGTVKMGRDLGIFGSDAILSDMTLLGVGYGSPSGSSTLGRIGNGYIYADWKGQISYTSPNWNGFSFAAGVMEGYGNGVAAHNSNNLAFEGKATYAWTGDVAGKVWVSGITQKHEGENALGQGVNVTSVGVSDTGYTSRGWDVGTNLSVDKLGLVAYYYDGKGLDSQNTLLTGLQMLNANKSDDKGGYVQATYVIPTGTKLGASWGTSKTESQRCNSTTCDFDRETESWIIGAYHPLTKSLNLVAEYADIQADNHTKAAGVGTKTKTDINQISLGAILFF